MNTATTPPKTRQPPFEMPNINPPSFPNRDVDIRDHGAVDDGTTTNTESFRRAIAACVDAGGGTVQVPAGTWLTGPIHLQSNIRLHLDAESVVRFSTRPADYLPVVFTRWEGTECYNYSPLIYANECSNVAVTGEGTFEGQGATWWHWKKLQQAAADRLYGAGCDGVPVNDRVFGTEQDALRPAFIQPINCTDVLIEGVTFKDGPFWTIHPVYTKNLIVRRVQVRTNGPNNDGLNPDSCKNVLIEHSFFSTGDDCIAINAGINEDGWRVGRPCENILIRHCRMERGHGGVVIGSGMSGGVRNVYAHNCRCDGTDIGIRLKSMRGRGGFVENVRIEDFEMNNVAHEAVRINMFYGATTVQPRTKTPPVFRNIDIRNISCRGATQALLLRGLTEQRLENIHLENLTVAADGGAIIEDVAGLTLNHVHVEAKSGPALVSNNLSGLQTVDTCFAVAGSDYGMKQ